MNKEKSVTQRNGETGEQRKTVCIISLADIGRMAPVLRQIEYLSPHYDLTVIGHGEAQPGWENVRLLTVPKFTMSAKRLSGAFLALGRLWPHLYESWYWRLPRHQQALDFALRNRADVYHANDWSALPIAAEAARRHGAKLVFTAHEYWPLLIEGERIKRLLVAPMMRHMIRRYLPQADASTTISDHLAGWYREHYGITPTVILNAPRFAPLQPRDMDPERLTLVHHGIAFRDRKLEWMIETVALAEARFSLHLILVPGDPGYVEELQALADRVAPGRVTFHHPVPAVHIVETLWPYDIGFGLIAPTNFNYLMAMPNKLFDFIAAGLAVFIGPSPAMADVVQKYRAGWVAKSFEPRELAETLNWLTAEDIRAARTQATLAAKELNADHEMGKLVALYERLLSNT